MPPLTSSRPLARRRSASVLAALALAASCVAAAATAMPHHSRTGTFAATADLGAVCQQVIPSADRGVPDSCAHVDEAPPGVDVDKPVPTAVLEAREGSAAAAVAAVQGEGVPAPAQAAAVTDRVPCDGDGSAGYRVQAIYVVTADKTNRYAAVGDQIKQWAAGVNTVFNLSAAKTGGVRNVRYVTSTNGDGTCSPKVLNVTVPAGSFASFDATITAMRNLGYTSPARKYLLWVDGTGQCGIAQTYPTSSPGQDNYNNGYAAQFARIDTGCWGGAASVEAHELAHTMGAVNRDAPHATSAGHCFDESDRMCYSDGGGKTMQQVCPSDQEVLLDCNNDDYYSTYPPAGSYLATHWNAANNRFLIGGGDGTGGGSLGVPTALGGTVSVNNPTIPGLPTQVGVNLEVPSGRTTTTAWTSARKDCVFTDPRAEQTEVTCDAKSSTGTTVTATVTDSTGAKMVRTASLTFSTTPRVVVPTMAVDGSSDATYTACPTGKGVLSATVIDQASGAELKGLTVAWFRKVGTTAPVQVATATTNADGVATSSPVTMTAGAYSARTTTATAFPSVGSGSTDVAVTASACSTTLTSSVDQDHVQAGSPVTVSGSLTRTLPEGGATEPAVGEKVAIYTQAPGATTWTAAGSATTAADGSYAAVFKPLSATTVELAVQARFLARTGFTASTTASVPVTVTPWTTALTVSPSATDVMGGRSVTYTGTLTQSDGTSTSALAGPVQVTYPVVGGKTATTTATANASGAFSATVRPTDSGTVTVRYAGKLGWRDTSATAEVTFHEWATELKVTPSATDVMAGAPVTLTGTLTQSDGVTATALPSSGVQVVYPVAGGKTVTTTATTNALGVYTATIRPTASGTVALKYPGKVGWTAATAGVDLAVTEWTTTLTMSATRNASTGVVAVSGSLKAVDKAGVSTPRAGVVVRVTYPLAGGRTAAVGAVTKADGSYTISVTPTATGPVAASYAGAAGYAAATADPVTITVPS